jgi:hypothetical protein
MGDIMKLWFLMGTLIGTLMLIIPGTLIPIMAPAQDRSHRSPIPEGVYLELTRDFYEALRHEGDGGVTVYTNDPSAVHLKEIAVSTRFLVQTNLEILKQQEIMNELLRRLMEKQ